MVSISVRTKSKGRAPNSPETTPRLTLNGVCFVAPPRINLHGGHHDFTIEQCEINYPGDDPFGLWPVAEEVKADPEVNCQTNIVFRSNIGRWPRQHSGMGTGSGGRSARNFPECDCSDAPPAQRNAHHNAFGCYSHACFGVYSGGKGLQFVNNTCEGAGLFLQLDGAFPAVESPNATNETTWCGPIVVAGNSVGAMPGQGSGCMPGNDTACPPWVHANRSAAVAASCTNWCNKLPPPWAGAFDPPPTVGGQSTYRSSEKRSTAKRSVPP